MEGQPLVAVLTGRQLDSVPEIATTKSGLGIALQQALAGARGNVALGLERLIALDTKEGGHRDWQCWWRRRWLGRLVVGPPGGRDVVVESTAPTPDAWELPFLGCDGVPWQGPAVLNISGHGPARPLSQELNTSRSDCSHRRA